MNNLFLLFQRSHERDKECVIAEDAEKCPAHSEKQAFIFLTLFLATIEEFPSGYRQQTAYCCMFKVFQSSGVAAMHSFFHKSPHKEARCRKVWRIVVVKFHARQSEHQRSPARQKLCSQYGRSNFFVETSNPTRSLPAKQCLESKSFDIFHGYSSLQRTRDPQFVFQTLRTKQQSLTSAQDFHSDGYCGC